MLRTGYRINEDQHPYFITGTSDRWLAVINKPEGANQGTDETR
jgi:hypothetical protein